MTPRTQQIDAMAVIEGLSAEIAVMVGRAVVAEKRAEAAEKRAAALEEEIAKMQESK